jgi:hypothetical protein
MTCAFTVTSKRRKAFPSETAVKRGDRVVRGGKGHRGPLRCRGTDNGEGSTSWNPNTSTRTSPAACR